MRRMHECLIVGLLLGAAPHVKGDILYSVTDLGPGSAYAYGINNAGQVTGGSLGFNHAFLYSSGQMTDLGTLGGTFGEGRAINNSGQVAGASSTSTGATHAFLYSNGQMTDLGTLPEGLGGYSAAFGINDAGQVTGEAQTSTGDTHAFLYSNRRMTDLGTLPGYPISSGTDINNAGQVTGSAGTPGSLAHSSHRAFLYNNGQMSDLNSLIDPALGITLTEATAISDKGQIVANSFGGVRAYLLTPIATPVPEPSTLALFGVALLGLGAWARRHPSVLR